MPIAVQAIPFLIALGALAAASAAAFGLWGLAPWVILACFVLFFFRDPERIAPVGEGIVLSPADGRVVAVHRGEAGSSVSIFLSAFDCHINRSPVTGMVTGARHTPGRFHPAWQGRASRENERNHLIIRASGGDYGVTQIAGILARRIVCTKRPGDRLARGERIGLIRFGSRTDLSLPPGVEPLVSVGDRVRGALTIVAQEALLSARVGDEAGMRRVSGGRG